MSSDLFGSSDAHDPWTLPSPKNTGWGASNQEDTDDRIPHEQFDQFDQTSETELQGEDEVNDNGFSSSLNNPLENSSHAAELEQSIWDRDPILSNDNNNHHTHNHDSTDNTQNNNDDDSESDFLAWSNSIRSSFNANSRDIITVTEIPEKEGLLFKHTNYLVKHLVPLPDTDSTNDRKVVRRYSDFFWLLEVLLKKFPFRLIPELPPKKLGASNLDPQFLERRRKGLQRFINQIMRHPVLNTQDLVIMFLTVPTDLSSWRKQANYDTTEEYQNKTISRQFIELWDSSSLSELWQKSNARINESLESWSKLTILIERFEKRSQQIAQDNARFIGILDTFKETTSDIYQVENSKISSINEGLRIIGKHLSDSKTLLNDESNNVEEGIMEEFKKYADYLNSLKALFERHQRIGGNRIGELKKRLEFNQQRLQELNGKPDVKGVEVDRITESIKKDEKEIDVQTNRDWLIKESLVTELVMFQETQFQITKIFQDWISDKLKYSELHSNNWAHLLNGVHDMPLTRHD